MDGGALELAKNVARRLRREGHRAFLVGGCVRDLLLQRPPKDFDVATSATPEEVLRLYPAASRVGAQFGVVLVKDELGQVEVATFRTDLAYRDGRRPGGVRYETDAQLDALRRDFTINALLMDPDTGEITDYSGGRADLEAGIVRAIGDARERFLEDHLRMLRAVRFASTLEFTIEETTLACILEQQALARRIAPERVRDELIKILTEGRPRAGFELLDISGLLLQVLPEVAALKGVPQPPEYHPEGDVWTHTMLMLEKMERPSITLALGVLLHDIAKPVTFRVADRIRFHGHAELGASMAVRILGRLRFSRAETERVELLVSHHSRFQDIRNMRASTLKRLLRLEVIDELLELHRLDCAASHRRMEKYEFARQALERLKPEELRPPRLVTGRDLLAAGYSAGPMFKEMLDRVETAQLEGAVKSREEALTLLESEFGDRRTASR
jgi:poly(A) polymerase